MSASIVWPPALTRTPRVDALEETAPDVLIRSEMDAGEAKVRRRFTGDVRNFTIVLDLKRSEVATFDSFFLTTTKGGALPFVWKHPRTGSDVDFRIITVPKYKPRAPKLGDSTDWWTVSFDVETMPGTDSSTSTPPGDVYLPGGGGYGFSEVVDLLDEPPAEEASMEVFDWFVPIVDPGAAPDFYPDLIYPHYGASGLDTDPENEPDDSSSSYIVTGSEDDGGTPPVVGAIVGGRTSIVPA